jgi:predicted ATPase
VIDRGYVADEVERTYARAWDLCERDEGGAQLLPVGGLYRYAVVRGEHRKGVELAQRMLAIAQRTGKDHSLFLFAHTMLGGSYWWCGEFAPAAEHMQLSRQFYDFEQNKFIAQAFGDDPLVASLSFLAYTRWMRGDPDESLKLSAEALDLARRLDHPAVSTLSFFLAAQLHHLRRDAAESEAHATQGMALASEYGLRMMWAVNALHRGWARVERGDIEAGAAELQAGLEVYRGIGADSGLPHYLSAHAEVLGRKGQAAQGLAALDEAFGIVARTDERWWEPELYRLRGELMLQAGGRAAQARASLQRAHAVAVERGAHALQLRAAVSLVRHGVGDPDAARALVREAMSHFAGNGDCRDVREAAEVLGQA